MKKVSYLFFSLLFSALVVMMGVGVPLIQYKCSQCAQAQADGWQLVKVEAVTEGCTCGCSHVDAAEVKACCCGSKQANSAGERTAGFSPAEGDCTSYTLIQIATSTVEHQWHLPEVAMQALMPLYGELEAPLYITHPYTWLDELPPPIAPSTGYDYSLCRLLI